MKNIYFVLFLISASLFGQQYEKNWNKVIENENLGKIKTANKIVAEIYKRAVANKDEVQIIKCFFYNSKYLQVVDENAQSKILNNLRFEINRASIPSKAILNLVYVKCLNDYLERNRYKISNITNTIEVDDNFLTWATANFENQIKNALIKSLENEAILKATPLVNYEAIFEYLTLENFKSQNLYDYVILENIVLYTKKIQPWGIQKSDFTSYKKELLGKTNDFIKLNLDFITNENLRLVLSLYQKKETNQPTAENQFKRILFSKNYLIENNDDYVNSLNILQKSTKNEHLIQKIQLQKAILLEEKASKKTHPDYNIKAIIILDSITRINNRSNTYKLALERKERIRSKSINIQLQKYTYNEENIRAYINYKNVDQLKISFYRISQKQLKEYENNSTQKKDLVDSIIQKEPLLSSKFYSLKNKKDYFEYSTEILLPNLKTGSYLVYFESESDTKDKKAFAFETITTSNISVLASQNDSKETFQVLDRKTGKPLENATIKSLRFNIQTDKDGLASYKKDSIYNYKTIELSHANDTILISKNYIQYSNIYNENEKEDSNGKVEFFLDRAIYRPGQTVYYKGIAIQKNKNKTNVVTNTTFKITIEDPNEDSIKEFNVTTNEFGSFSGKFTLPKNGLTGNFRIITEEPNDYEKDSIYNKKKAQHPFWDNVHFENSQSDFRVEEYKRPKFEVTFEPKKESFQLNQAIKVKGTAKAFAGSIISDAKVTYTVTRYINYFRNYYGREEPEVLVTEETKTDASGKFIIDFMAVPSKNSNKEQLPIFNYIINASITDINGETHTAETTIKVGYHDLILNATLPNKIETKNKNEITLTSTNLNGEFLATKGEIKIYYISPFSNKFKSRTWEKPEINNISEQDFEILFPFENNKKDTLDKATGTLVFSKKVNTEKDKKVTLDFISNYKSGNYKIVFSAKDSFNNPIESSSEFKLTQSEDKYDTGKLFTVKQTNDDPKKDGFVLLKITSVIPELYIITTGNYDSKVFFEETKHLKNNEVTMKIPLKNEFEKQIKLGFESVFENQTFNDEVAITLKNHVPTLNWKVESFRNKIQPGSSENWSFQLNTNGTRNEAEVLASMYDSSLDQFTTKDWSSLDFNRYNYNGINTKTYLGFEKTSTSVRNLNTYLKGIQVNNETTNLIWFGFNFNTPNSIYQQKEYQKQLSKKTRKPANAKLIWGIISDNEGLPLPGASITVKNTPRSTTSDFDGYYEIDAATGEELVFSYVGMQTKTVEINNSKEITIALEEDSNQLQEVVVTALGMKKEKKSMSYSVEATGTGTAAIVEEDNQVNNTLGISDSLQGFINGVSISKSPTNRLIVRGASSIATNKDVLCIIDGEIATEETIKNLNPSVILSVDVITEKKATALYGNKGANGAIIITTKNAIKELTQVKARKNLSETAFFLPNLKTDAKGNVSFNFTSPEVLTAWKLRLLAHNKDAVSSYLEKSVITQKELMVLPNFPRFLREKDTIVISTKISNITAEAKTGIAILQFFDATTMQPIDAKMLNVKNVKNFTVEAFGNTTASWTVSIPEGIQGVQYKILAKSGNFSDGEENILPVLTNNMLVTESIPIWVRENSTKEYTLENLKNNTSTTLKNHQLTLEYTSNPAWIAIQSLPYLMEYEHECAEQTFARFYANSLASEIISSNPKIATIFENWRKNEKLNSKLEENEELKSIIIAETPWLNDAQSEDEKKKNLALLFDLEKMKTSQEATFDKLKQKQKISGGFSWFDGSDENEYITRHILAGLGHLSKLNKTEDNNDKIDAIAKTGIPFLDNKFLEYYKTKNLKATNKLIWINPYSDLHYLYTRSFYLDNYPLSDTLKKATKLYLETTKKDWLKYSLYEKGLAVLTLNRFGESETAKKIIESLKETASNNEDWGMYWITNKAGWYWYQAPIETQALLIEAFAEVNNDTKSVDAMKVWLLKNKQTKNWPTTKSTTEAVYALLMQGKNGLSIKDNTVIKIGDEKILNEKLNENEKEATTGYIKLNWKADEVKKEMASVKIENKSKISGLGGIYWQYFEDLDKIKTNPNTALSVSKELYIKTKTVDGDQLQKITTKSSLKMGDLITVRLIISSKENMEFVHLKDMRASCFEPVNVLSEYKYNDRLGYYISTKDAATHFFFDEINKGTYVLEYDIRVNNGGNFSNGISTIQSMYAPEYSSHSKGIRVNIK
ncbi:carboxypeptidase-like regulatory domain-containing protein [Flavobacterium sp. 140616W15]|uniref:alpha-2-macroglobulin family protein n=1 Tax=Flavobacterium sp. 140616W15 TaxID=2478552 RepID=UPI000F0C5B9E|nr:carboxypeptidase-like regulatory domain-containing protein [Flavobacterium sp. 140616W15]AYN05273.1 alpha-2-macroglobulin [Flavobacterium sp. 140616W15]